MARTRASGRRPPSSRELTVRVLQDVERREAFSNRTLSEHLERHPGLDPRDRGFTTTLVYGVLRHRARLDAHIDHHARKPSGLKGEVRQVLRIAAFEMLELRRPAAIAIAEARKVVRGLAGGQRLGGVLQAILSGIDREGAAFDRTLEQGSPESIMERRWSIPAWLASRWVRRLGAQRALERAQAVARPLPIDLRIDAMRATADEIVSRLSQEHPGIELERVEGRAHTLRARGGGDLFYGALHDEGLISVQGLGAQQAARLLDPQPGERVLDACAGMGVKTLQLCEMMQRRGQVVAADADPNQLAKLDDVIERGRLDTEALELRVVCTDVGSDSPELDAQPFDAILLDVPCTGLGNLARHPEIRWLRSEADLTSRTRLQRDLLERCLERLRPGGRLVYAACTIEPEEGTQIVHDVVRSGRARLVEEQTWTPEEHGSEGFYLARLEPPA